MTFKEYFLLRESPDSIIPRFSDNEFVSPLFFNRSRESYSVFFIKHEGEYKIIYRKDKGTGHTKIQADINRFHKKPEVLDDVYSELPKAMLKDVMEATADIVEVRVWTENKIVSFHFPWEAQYVHPTIRVLALLKQDPKQYIYEMDGNTYDKSMADNIDCLTYAQFTKGELDKGEKVQQHRQKKLGNRNLMAAINMGMIKDGPSARKFGVGLA